MKNNRQGSSKTNRIADVKTGSNKGAVDKIVDGVTNKTDGDNVFGVLMTVNIVTVMPKKELF